MTFTVWHAVIVLLVVALLVLMVWGCSLIWGALVRSARRLAVWCRRGEPGGSAKR